MFGDLSGAGAIGEMGFDAAKGKSPGVFEVLVLAVTIGGGGELSGVRNFGVKELKRLGIDAEALKEAIAGEGLVKRFNLARDRQGRLFLVPVNKGSSPSVAIELTVEEAQLLFPIKKD